MADASRNGQSLPHERKVGFVFLLIFAILTVSLGALQLRNTIYGPFVRHVAKEDSATLLIDENTRLRQIDTDQDGLSDYDELFFYETSPYIPDTDSDGISDKEELDAGTDPLCPKGKDCEALAAENLESDGVQAVESPIGASAPSVSDILSGAGQPSTASVPGAIDFKALLNDPAALRELLVQTGKISKEQLDQISDQELLDSVSKILAIDNEGTGGQEGQ